MAVRHSEFRRHPHEVYVEDAWFVDALADRESFRGGVHDPTVGSSTIPRSCEALGIPDTGADIVDRGWPGTRVQDFLTDGTPRAHIVTNPPYILTEQFIHHALRHVSGKVEFLTRLAFLEGMRRYETLYSVTPPARV
jgi:hypothetical protein